MHTEILTPAQQSALAVLSQQAALRDFYLAGGTALALHLGHRASEDFDFFRQQSFDPQWLLRQLPAPPRVVVLQEARDTLTVEFRGVKMSFFAYPHNLIKPLLTGALPVGLASIPDIAAMKLAAIAGRGSRKDFVDMYFICRQCFPLKEAFTYLQAKFSGQQYDLYHILRSLTYFTDAEAEPMPLLCSVASWDEMKRFLTSEASRLRL
jgi:predicted nucleotidyltransferase component of viral defense system